MPPKMGPTIGIQAYAQSELPLPAIGKIACAKRGPKSRAGLIAYPVGPPRERPMANTINPTIIGPKPVAHPGPDKFAFEGMARTPKTRVAVPIISQSRLENVERIAGPVQKTASLAPVSGVFF